MSKSCKVKPQGAVLAPTSKIQPLPIAAPQGLRTHFRPHTFLVSALGRVPNWGSVGLSTGLLISDGTDSVLLIFVTEKQVGEGRKTSLMRLFILAIPSITLKCREFVENYLLGRKDILQAGASLVHLL